MPGLIFAQIQEEANKAHEMAVTSLEDNVRSLEQKCTDAEQNNINLKKEMEEVRELEKANLKKREQNCHKSTQTTLDSTHSGNDIVIGNAGKAIHDHPSLAESSQSPQLSPRRPSNESSTVLSSHITPTKSSVVHESRVDSLHPSPMKQSTKAAEASRNRTEETASGSEDILDVLASRIDQLAASDSEDDIFRGTFCLIY